MTPPLAVYLGKQCIGTLTLHLGDSSFFTFEESYLNMPKRPTLSQSFLAASGEVVLVAKSTRVKLPPFFSNLLPEGHLRDYLAKRGGVNPAREFMLLALLGDDLPGAVIVKPLKDSSTGESTPEYPNSLTDVKPFHFSLAGIQLKFSAIVKGNGLTIPADGVGGNWIIKLPAQNFSHVPQNEWAMLHLASAVGIPVPETRLIKLDHISGLPDLGIFRDTQALAVKRFDRGERGKRIHIEDFAQVYNLFPEDKYGKVSYDNIANMVWVLTGEVGLTDFIRRLTFTILIGNGDMHLKNWSFIYRDGCTPELTPAYDFVSTIPYIPSDNLALKLSGMKEFRLITMEHFKKLAIKAEVPTHLVLKTVQSTVETTLDIWKTTKKNYDLQSDIINRIEKHIDSLLIVRR